MFQTPLAGNGCDKVLWFFNYQVEVKGKKDIIILKPTYCDTRGGFL